MCIGPYPWNSQGKKRSEKNMFSIEGSGDSGVK